MKMEKKLKDRVWQNLPEDFRSHVRRMYNAEVIAENRMGLSERRALLIDLFGVNNLTSADSECDKDTCNITQHTCNITPRLQIASMAMQGMLNNPKYDGLCTSDIAHISVRVADAIINKCEKGESK